MNYSFTKLVYKAVCKKIKALKNDKSANLEQSLKHAENLEEIKEKLFELKNPELEDFYYYSDYSNQEKTLFKNAAQLVCKYCAITIRNRCLELGFDNYDNSINILDPESLLNILKAQELYDIHDHLKTLLVKSNEKNELAKCYGLRTHPMTLSQEVVSAIFRADKIINLECDILMLTIYSFIQKKASYFATKNPVTNTGLDVADFFNVISIGYLNASFYWNPNVEKENNSKRSVFALFPKYGWTFAQSQINLLIYSRRLVKFPQYVEENILKVQSKMKELKLELISQQPHLTTEECDKIVAQKVQDDLQKIQSIFSAFIPNGTIMTSTLPTEQRIINLNDPAKGTDNELLNFVEDKSIIDPTILIDQEFLTNDLYKQLELLPSKKRVIIKLKFGLNITPKEWQDSGFKSKSGIKWKNLKIQPYKYKEIGDMIGLRSEKIKSIELNCLRNLRTSESSIVLTNHYEITKVKAETKVNKDTKYSLNFFEQMQELDLQKFYKLCNHNYQKPKGNFEVIIYLDSLNLLSTYRLNQCLVVLLTKLYKLFQDANEFDKSDKIPELFLAVIKKGELKFNHFDLDKPATFKEIEYHFNQILLLVLKSTMLQWKEKQNLNIIYNYFNQNPLFLVNVL